MSTYSTHLRPSEFAAGLGGSVSSIRLRLPLRRGLLFGLIFLGALLAFESFNYGTTEFALRDLLGELSSAGLRWSTILALAFCGMDFAGIARIFMPESSDRKPAEVWYLIGAWFLAATMNATLTWWAVSLALISHQGLGNEVLGRQALLNAVPAFVAVLVWLIRILMIGTITMAGDRIFAQHDTSETRRPHPVREESSLNPSRPAAASEQAGESGTRRQELKLVRQSNSRSHQRPLAARPPTQR
ncbi:MAG: hypothetical protein A2Z37_01915 [Chloroflexi bacterium RBG_19FT_COMBO_62_14]|nr:MAG: hypothetical protein A2Z37_01915 [Chloroflexi bacterium RBG_19FT_COMBO_62_14]